MLQALLVVSIIVSSLNLMEHCGGWKNGANISYNNQSYPNVGSFLGDGTTIARHSPVQITPNWNNINNWNHVSLVFDRDQGKIHRYVNGVRLDILTMTNPAGTLAGTELLFGAGADLNASQFFHGSIDDLRIFSRSLSAEKSVDSINSKLHPALRPTHPPSPPNQRKFSVVDGGTAFLSGCHSDSSTINGRNRMPTGRGLSMEPQRQLPNPQCQLPAGLYRVAISNSNGTSYSDISTLNSCRRPLSRNLL